MRTLAGQIQCSEVLSNSLDGKRVVCGSRGEIWDVATSAKVCSHGGFTL